MKRCSECGRDYNDDSLMFCLDDGAALLFGPRSKQNSADEPATAILDQPALSQLVTEPRIHHQSPAAKAKTFDRRLLLAPVALAVIVLGGFFVYQYFGSTKSGVINSIAVLPFENRSGSPDTDYLSDGLTDSLIFRFSQLPNVKVSPTSSVMRYKGKLADVNAIAKELEVDAVLSGRLIQLGDSLTINVQLIDARSGKLIWAEQYDRKMQDMLATQREIATTLTEKMQLGLASSETGIAKKYTNSNEAYQLYLRGRYHYAKRTHDDMLKAIENYQKAIELDQNFALAYASTAEAYNSMGKNPDVAPKDCIPFGKAAARRALELDPELPQAHAALGDSLAIYDWNWQESEKHFKRALELDQKLSYTHVLYGISYLTSQPGRTAEVVRELERAVEGEPVSMINNTVLGSAYFYARQPDKALKQAQTAFDLDPSFPLSRFWLGNILIANQRYEEAIALGQQVPTESPTRWMAAAFVAQAYARAGKRAEAEKWIAELRELGKKRYVRSYYIASALAALGDKDKAFAELEKSFAERDCYLSRITNDPFMDPLRDDPRFKNLLSRMNLSP